ncbi:hypothetical protein E2562_031957 [Oryza meyeriana var. granulata]|uniref:Uncharacterized protein n=1 Tax=Oryza meyeriana var. granulata TaxID=110450 RepID=A0A6G1ERT9_9ORYZ|nr:hypothetical protein E2562_031957 [Oryza meyeriana var. granulata]
MPSFGTQARARQESQQRRSPHGKLAEAEAKHSGDGRINGGAKDWAAGGSPEEDSRQKQLT